MPAKFSIKPEQVFPFLVKWLLRDGYDFVIDME